AMRQQAVELPLGSDISALEALAETLETEAATALEGVAGPRRVHRAAHLRYAGTDSALPVTLADEAAMRDEFDAAHRARFGVSTPDRPILVESIVVEVVRSGETVASAGAPPRDGAMPEPIDHVDLWSDGAHRAPVYDRETLRLGDRIVGPALIREAIATTVV